MIGELVELSVRGVLIRIYKLGARTLIIPHLCQQVKFIIFVLFSVTVSVIDLLKISVLRIVFIRGYLS